MTTPPNTEDNADRELEQRLQDLIGCSKMDCNRGVIMQYDTDGEPFASHKCHCGQAVATILGFVKDQESALLSRIKEEGPKHIDPGVYTVTPISGKPNKHMTTGFNNCNSQWQSTLDTIKAEIEGARNESS
jgi:hypothetical protein